MQKAEIIDYLKIKAGGKLMMTPEQLEAEIGISTKQQSVLRTQERFPIPHKKIGRSVFYSIIHIADFLMDGEVYVAPKQKYEPKPPPKQSRSKSNTDLSHLFLLKAFVSNMDAHIKQQQSIFNFMSGMAKAKEMYEDLNTGIKQ